ncbi:hypothetical protein HDU78_001538 [Chytriomyces hyalinus]|nr:hypothetical protein HDU78_001538 [Chytriomyces hyalinus]
MDMLSDLFREWLMQWGSEVHSGRTHPFLLPNSDSSMVDTQSAMSSVTTHSPKRGSLKGPGESSPVEWQESSSHSQQREVKVEYSGATTSNTAGTEPSGSGINSSISECNFPNCCPAGLTFPAKKLESQVIAHVMQTRQFENDFVDLTEETSRNDSRLVADASGKLSSSSFPKTDCSETHYQIDDSRAIQTEVIGVQDLWKDDGRAGISRQMDKGGQECVIRRSQSSGETLAQASASESARNDVDGHLHSSTGEESMIAINLRKTHVHSTAACNVRSVVGLLIDNDGEAPPDVVQSADTTNSSLGPRNRHSDRLEKDIAAIADSAVFSPVHPDILADTASDMVLNEDASHGSARAEVPLENSKNDMECDDVKFEGRVTRLSRKQQLASIEPSAKRHRTSSATYYGRIEDSLDAGIVIEACIKGILREVSGAMEVSSIEIRSGTVLVIHERDGNIQRWRDGYQWSPSRISGGFLIYRQVERKDSVTATEAEETQTIPSTADGSKLAKGKSFTVLPDGLTKKTIGMIGSDRQSYRVISYYETEDARVRTSLINIRELDSPRISAHKALPRPSKDELFSSLGLYPKDSDASTSNGWRNKRKRRAVVIPQIDRRYPEYEPQMSDYPIMFPYRQDPVATGDSQARPSTTEKLVHRKEVSNGQPSSSHQKRTPTALAPQYSREFAVGQYLNAPAPPLVAFTSSSSSAYHHQGSTLHYSAQYDAYQGMTGGFMSQQQQYQQQYTLGPGYFQPPSGYGPRPTPSNGHHRL